MRDPMRPTALNGPRPESSPHHAAEASIRIDLAGAPAAPSRSTVSAWLALAFAVPLVGCGEKVVAFPRVDETQPTVVLTSPISDETDAPRNGPITVTFSEAMAPTSLTSSTFVVRSGAEVITGSVSYSGSTAIFSPDDDLAASTNYEATVTTGATDVAGNVLLGNTAAGDYVWTFETAAATDDTRPVVTRTTPSDGDGGVALNVPVTATFSESMAEATLSASTFTVRHGTEVVPGSIILTGTTAVFVPDEDFLPEEIYTATVDASAADLAGNTLEADYVWTFTTGDDRDETAPTVISTRPISDADNVALNGAISATFSEPMASQSISTLTMAVVRGATAVPGNVDYAGVTAIFTPNVAFLPATTYTVTIKSAVTDVAGNPMVADYQWSFTTGGFLDTTAPIVESTTPAAGATAVALNAAITATFSETMDPLSLSALTVQVEDDFGPISGHVLTFGSTAIFNPDLPLQQDMLYTVTITTGAKDLAGNAMAADYQWTFTTGILIDSTAPVVESTTPADGGVAIALNTSITASFSEAMDPVSMNTVTMTVEDASGPITGQILTFGPTVIFNPDVPFQPNTTVTVTISTGAQDLAGNAMAAAYEWSFVTGPFVDLTPPVVLATVPLDDAISVSVDTTIDAIFSEEMNPLTVTGASFTVTTSGVPVAGTVTYSGVTARFTPAARLPANTVFDVTITSFAKDLAGNALVADETWTFETGGNPDEVAPQVTFTVPSDDADNVPVDSKIAAVFSEAMDASTLQTASFSVQQLGAVVPGIVSYAGITATFTPTLPLSPNTVYTAVITTSATDLAGTPLAFDYVWSFQTGGTEDITSPFVTKTTPMDGELDVVLDTLVSATFSDVMDPVTLTTQSFLVSDGVNDIAGFVTVIGNTVVFEPSSQLLPNTLYTATIEMTASDLTGNPMEVDYVWTFTTGTLLDVGAPSVIATNPADLATNVSLGSSVNATFSDEMDPLTISTASFKVFGPGQSEVMGLVTYDVLTRIATFEPFIELQPDTEYTAEMSTDAADLAGSPLLSTYTWTFSTGQLSSMGPAGLNLGSLTTFVAVAGAGLTNSNSSGITVLNGDVGLSPTATCLGDGSPCSADNPVINGTLYANDPGGIAAKAKVDLTAAYTEGFALPPGTTVNDISSLTLAPGVYTSGSTMSVAVGGTVTLDGQGDSNAVWVFQIGSSLTVNNGAKVLLVNGAKAGNVYWVAFASSTLGSNVEFAGNVLAGSSNSVGTDSTVVGRLLCITGMITLLSNTITLPAP